MEKESPKSFKDLIVWQKSASLAVLVYRLTTSFPKSELYGLTNQIRRSAVSISSKMIAGLIKSSKRYSSKFLGPAFLFLLLNSIFYILNPFTGYASSHPVLYFEGPTAAVGAGDELSVKVLIESDEPVNAYSLTIGYSDATLAEIISFSDAGSIADLKREPPQVTGPTSIKFVGASLKPFQGKAGFLFAVNFKALRPGLLELGVSGPKVYLADGKGTKIIPQAETFEILIGEGRESLVGGSATEDKAAPEIEFLSLVDDPITPRQKLLSFLVKDDLSGVKEAAYRERRWFWWGSFKPAQNPTAIPLRTWSVEVKVFDNAGNAASRVVYDWETFVKSNFVLWLILVFAMFTVVNKRIKRKRL